MAGRVRTRGSRGRQPDGVPSVLLLSLGAAEPGDALAAGVTALRRAGVRVHLVSRRPPSQLLLETLTSESSDSESSDGELLGGEAPGGVTALPPGRPTSVSNRLRGRAITLPGPLPALRLDPDRLPAAVRLVRHPATRSLVAAAGGVVAVDQAAIPAAWLAGRRHRRLVALNGLPAAVQRWAGGTHR